MGPQKKKIGTDLKDKVNKEIQRGHLVGFKAEWRLKPQGL